MRKKLPICIQTFLEIREDGCYYVEKTSFTQQMIEQGKYYFLSRPQRFGNPQNIRIIDRLISELEERMIPHNERN